MPVIKCPLDASPMDEKQVKDSKLDICPNCGGVWMDWGEMRKISGGIVTEYELLYRGRTDMKCPKCASRMNQSDLHSLLVEDCTKGCGVFFEKGESEKIFGKDGSFTLSGHTGSSIAMKGVSPITNEMENLVDAMKGMTDKEKAEVIVRLADGLGILKEHNWCLVEIALSEYELKDLKKIT